MTNMPKDDGFPAFPVISDNHECYSGMSLRDYFAGKAMQGIVSSPEAVKQINNSLPAKPLENIAAWSYRMADVMLEARK